MYFYLNKVVLHLQYKHETRIAEIFALRIDYKLYVKTGIYEKLPLNIKKPLYYIN